MRIKKITLLLFIICNASCDVSMPLFINENRYIEKSTKCGNITIWGATLFHEHIFAELDGIFTIKPALLKIQLNTNDVEITNLSFFHNDIEITNLSEEININGTEEIGIRFDYKVNTYPYIELDKKSLLILLLPSNFIVCEGKPFITDTIKIKYIDVFANKEVVLR